MGGEGVIFSSLLRPIVCGALEPNRLRLHVEACLRLGARCRFEACTRSDSDVSCRSSPRHAAWSVVGCPWQRPLGSAMSSPVGLPTNSLSQLAATDVSAQTTMKDAAKCDKHCEMQNSVNQQTFERTLRCRVTPGSMSTSVSIFFFLHPLLKTAGEQ